jgi:hypothetical protein
MDVAGTFHQEAAATGADIRHAVEAVQRVSGEKKRLVQESRKE